MTRSLEEKRHTQRFEAQYATAQSPVMRSIERSVCGCDYGATSWTTRAEANQSINRLGLRAGVRLLDLGAGSGWPGLYICAESGCDVVLVDLPLNGLGIAAERARRSGIEGRTLLSVADAACLPFQDSSFDAISHSDLLCCLRQKGAVLAACRRVIRRHGCMVFTVISIEPGLRPAEYSRAVASAPEFAESDAGYPDLLQQAGWAVTGREDVTEAYAETCRRQLHADEKYADELAVILGTAGRAERMDEWRRKLKAISDKLLRREVFEAIPA